MLVVFVVFLTRGFYVSELLFHATDTPPQLPRPMKASTGSELYTLWLLSVVLLLSGFSVTVLPRALRF